ncbi:MORN motif protein (macronuclear) [Tetrahymena thermophila SB210]|uniref:MORN motif protein n=1 Tax=Tetrahymena thermophila (strain SB210) TaxID=312017 RepID=I7M8N9_TETTS|nr:MORN motif protein [Tetrahymena thermophila SB210]EAR99380.2 MORN motif protein [Tetrahymena thermophila SB210]|eukprot:XP_001019625.2 MORN motif protein [Tetrahymena thermophila SB210]
MKETSHNFEDSSQNPPEKEAANKNTQQYNRNNSYQKVSDPPQDKQLNLKEIQQAKEFQKNDIGSGEPSTRIQTQSQHPMSSGSNKNNQNGSIQQDLNSTNIQSSNQQSPQMNSINYKPGKNQTPQSSNNKENIISGQNSIDMQISNVDDQYISQRQQPQQMGYSSRIRNQKSDSFIDESNLNRSHHNMIVAIDNQGTTGFGTQSQIFEGNFNTQQQAVFQRILYLKEQIQALQDHDSLLEFFKAYTVHNPDIITIDEILKSEHVKLKRYKQSVYFGDMINNQRCGKGIMIYFNGRAYEGEWQNDYKFGRGFELYPNGNRYEGYFVNGKSEGMGTYVWANNEIYDGQWLGGMKHGSGMWRGPKGDSYIGEWKFGKSDGYGVHTWVNGDRYEGQFKVCLKHGEGSERFSNGDLYQGQYVNGRPEGYGEYTWANNSHYKGTFKNGLRHGKGVWRRNLQDINSDKYEGEYQNDKKCGFGVFRWASGNEFRGNYFDDLRHGYGEMFWTDGSYYKGFWERGIQSGEGELFIPGEGVKRGLFVNNIFKGNCVSDEDEFVNKQQQNLIQYNQQQQLFRESSKFRLSPTKQQNLSKSVLRNKAPQNAQKHNSVSPNHTSLSKRTPSKSSTKKNLPDSVQKSNGKIGIKQTPSRKSAMLNSTNSNSKNLKSFLQDENIIPESSKSNQNSSIENNPIFSKEAIKQSNSNIEGNGNDNDQNTQQNQDKYKETANYLRNSYTEEDQANHIRNSSDEQRRTKSSNGNNLNAKINQQPYNKIYNNNNSNSQISSNNQDKRRSISVSGNRPNFFMPNLRNSSITPNPNKNNSFANNQHSVLPQINGSGVNNKEDSIERKKNGRKQKQILLKKHEIILWKNLRPKLNLRKGMYKDYTDPITVQRIRMLLHPPVWKPAGISNLDYSPEREKSSDKFNEVNHSLSHIYTNQKRLNSNYQ